MFEDYTLMDEKEDCVGAQNRAEEKRTPTVKQDMMGGGPHPSISSVR